MDRGGIIYLITNTKTLKQYVGKTVQPLDRRWSAHKSQARCGRGNILAAAIRKYGENAFIVEEVVCCLTLSALIEAEIKYIARYNTLCPNGYNISSGGDGGSIRGAIRSVETRERISSSRKGKKHSIETKTLLSNSHRGKSHSAETRIKMSESATKRWSDRKSPEKERKTPSEMRGIQFRFGKYRVRVYIKGKRKHIGSYSILEEAKVVRDMYYV